MDRLLVLAIILVGCQAISDVDRDAEVPADVATRWERLLHTDGCLTGGQDWRPDGMSEGCCLREAGWQSFLRTPLEDVVPFLLGRIDSTRATSVHVCPFQNADEGELAVYALQHLLHANWVDMPGGNPVVDEARPLHGTHRQIAIQTLLGNRESRELVKAYFSEIRRGAL